MGAVFGVTDLGQHPPRCRLHGLGQGVDDVGRLVHPAALRPGFGEHLAQRPPEPEGAVADSEHRCPHPAPAEVAQQVGPRLSRLPVAVADGDQLLGAIGADTHDDQAAQPFFFEPDVEVHTVGPDVHEVPVPQDRVRRRPAARPATASSAG